MSFQRFIADYHMVDAAQIVPERIKIAAMRSGDKVGDQQILSFHTGNGFHHYVAMVDWEDWGAERCARLAFYHFDGVEYVLCEDVCELGGQLAWPKGS